MRLLRLLVFFPYVSFNLLPSETFPWAFFYTVRESIRCRSWTKFLQEIKDDRSSPFLLFLFLSSLSAVFYAFFNQKEEHCLKCLFSYLNPLCIYVFLVKSPIEEIGPFCKLVGSILFFYILLGVLQFFGLIDILQPLFDFILYKNRGGTEIIDNGGRGVCLLTGEPSFAVVETIFVYLAWSYLHSYSGMRKCILDIAIFFFLALFLRSSIGVVIFAVYLLLEYRCKMIMFIFIAIPFVISFLSTAEERALQFLYTIFSSNSVEDIFFFVSDSSGGRLGSLIVSYSYVFTHPLSLGRGVGLWNSSSAEILSDSVEISRSVLVYSLRPSSYMASVAMDMGLVGVIFPIEFI